VLTHEKHHRFTVKEDVRQELVENALGGAGGQGSFRVQLGVPGVPQEMYEWTVEDASETVRAKISIEVRGNAAFFTLADVTGAPLLGVRVDHSASGGMRAIAEYPDGRAMFQAHGNLAEHDFLLLSPSGAELAKVHRAWAPVRDTYNLDVTGDVDPLWPLVFAIIIDREKAKK
jgi:hypothetical protein